jgi:hypothetical protein
LGDSLIIDKNTSTSNGFDYCKLFAKDYLRKPGTNAGTLHAQAFIKPLEDTSIYKDGTDEPCVCKNFEIKISEIQMALLDYNIAKKEIKIDLYLPDYNELKQYEDLESTIEFLVMQIIGKIAFRKHMREINLRQMPMEPKGLLSLIELPDFIDYLYKINSRKKTRQV